MNVALNFASTNMYNINDNFSCNYCLYRYFIFELDQFIEEAERSLHDAIMIVRRAIKQSSVVPGGGAVDMEVSRHLREHARGIAGKSQLFMSAFAKALEVIPKQLCENAGFDATDVLNKLRQKHAGECII